MKTIMVDNPRNRRVRRPTVAERIREYIDLGIDTFILSGYPHLEEAYRFAELVFPQLPTAADQQRPVIAANTGPFGETIANDLRPERRQTAQS